VKLEDLWRSRGRRDYDLDDIMLLKVGRHLRPRPHFKLIVGREDGENNFLRGYASRFLSLRTSSHPGPRALLDGEAEEADVELAARLVARFSQGREAEEVVVEVSPLEGPAYEMRVAPYPAEGVPEAWYV
jgi:hypothetical protein